MSYAWNYTSRGNLTVTLNWPSSSYLSYKDITFNYTPSTTGSLTNCTLYTNRTGSFTSENFSSSITNNQPNYFTLTFANDGSYIWNVYCRDNQGNSRFAATNKSFVIDTVTPNVNLERPPTVNI